MSTSPPLSSLPDDIHRALQQAVGDANNAASAHIARHHAKKSKRSRENYDAGEDGDSVGDGASVAAKKKKKLKKHHGVAEMGESASPEQPAINSGDSGETTDDLRPDGVSPDDSSAPPKKKKRSNSPRTI